MRQCSIVFEGVDPSCFTDDWEVKRNTLLEVVDYCDMAGRQLFTDFRALEDAFTMVRRSVGAKAPKTHWSPTQVSVGGTAECTAASPPGP